MKRKSLFGFYVIDCLFLKYTNSRSYKKTRICLKRLTEVN